jgi:hypothetical protein
MDVRIHSAGICLFAIVLLVGCDSSSESTTPTPTESVIHLDVPLELTVQQRTTTVIRGSENRLSLTIDDITGNQVMVSLGTDTGETPIPMRSMSPGGHRNFEYAGTHYVLTLEELVNALIGEDTARFTITASSGDGLDEQAKIEQLIEAVANLEGATFIRNETEHSAAEAAEHLRTKWNAARDQITTARQFIDEIASKSSLSGEPYQIRFGDGTTVTAADFLNQELAKTSTQ